MGTYIILIVGKGSAILENSAIKSAEGAPIPFVPIKAKDHEHCFRGLDTPWN